MESGPSGPRPDGGPNLVGMGRIRRIGPASLGFLASLGSLTGASGLNRLITLRNLGVWREAPNG